MNEDEQMIWGLPLSFELFIGGFNNPQATLTIVDLNKLAARERYIQQLLDRQKNSEIVRVHTPEGETSTSPLVIGMSGTDPVGLFAVETAVLGKPFIWAGKGALYGLARFGSGKTLNWARAKLFSGLLNSSIPESETSGVVPYLILNFKPTQVHEPRTSLRFFERPLSRISEAEGVGIPKGERNIRLHGSTQAPYYDYSLLNRNYEPWTINEKGQFVFDSPEKARKLSTIHFSLNEPVRRHIQGSWDDAPTITLLPYRNMRSLVAPADVAIMDTFFPNYKGLKISSRGSKTLTGDRATFDYYKSHDVDVEFSPELESLRKELLILNKRLEEIPPLERYKIDALDIPDYVKDLNTRYEEITNEMDRIVRAWSEKYTKRIPSFEKLNEFGRAEGFDIDNYPYLLGTPVEGRYGSHKGKLGLDYGWVTDPSNHAGAILSPERALESTLEYNARPEYIEWLKWLINHLADYRKQGGKIIERFKNRNK